MKPFTYLLINFLTVIICFIASFDKRIQFNKYFGSFVKSAILVSIPFIVWDIWFTARGVWWFNSKYTIGLSIAGLPIEEFLFFICIPFSCVFTYFCFDKFINMNWVDTFNNIIVFVIVTACVVIALLHFDKIYTFLTAVTTTLTLIYLRFIAHVSWIGKASTVFFILMLFFFPVNGALTGTGLESAVVNYNPDDFLGIRMLTIPIEDAFYGYTHFLLVVYFFKIFQNEPCEIKE
ncbi:lycopene cyclase domain-containing protein [Solitalea koreensis]|uniref:Lycopene cyclase domain-containing protein n=1 Tax=Solitalea koreensis TaxID=543615 RepID=A0A521DDF8_9SPHI|nr:lycopene cyclase domain-containing protein [Solitalea koreensis]SMO69628.1 lycopene cyclase domain-containing protein [Solitalea koreensis]